MDSPEKIIKKFLTDQQHITMRDCDRLLIAYGYKLHKSSGSHRSYHKYGTTPINIISPKKSRYILIAYVNRIIKDLGLED